MNRLVERLQAKATLLGQRAIAEMYQDPFWQARFGARGRENAEKDSQFHLSYVTQALASSDPGVMTGYARWLQTLLVSRGMCSRHIAENFGRLATAIAEEVTDSAPAVELLRAGRAALVYDGGPARELQLVAPRLAEAAIDVLAKRQPSWFSAASSFPSLAAFESVAQSEVARFERDVLEHISYLADTLHAGRPELFAEHAAWTRDFLARRQVQGARLQETLLALDDCLGPPPPEPSKSRRPSAAGSSPTASEPPVAGFTPRSSLRPPPPRPASQRPSLSPPPSDPTPVPVSPELAVAVRGLLALALERLAVPTAAKTPSAAVKGFAT